MKVRNAETLKRWRKRRNLTQRELAFLCRCSQNAIFLLESGGMTTLSEDLALSIAKRLDVPWEDLFESHDGARVPKVADGKSGTGQTAIEAAS
jgi:putative transcriptional regulator